MHPSLPLRSPVLVHALYHCAPPLLTATLASSLAQLPTPSGHSWHLSWPTSTSATLWQPAEASRPLILTFHLSIRPPAVTLWTLATTPDQLLLGAGLILSLDGALPRYAAARGLPSGTRQARWPVIGRSPTPALWPHRGLCGGPS